MFVRAILITALLLPGLSVLAQGEPKPAGPAPEAEGAPAPEEIENRKSKIENSVLVTLVSSRSNQVALEAMDLDYRKGVKYWASLVEKAGLRWRIAGDYELETEPQQTSVYVIHMAERLTEKQRANLERLRESGVGMILVGVTGMLDGEGKRVPSLAEDWFGLKGVTEFKPGDSAYFAARAGTVFSAGNLPGFRFEYLNIGRYFVAQTPYSVGLNLDWTLNPIPDVTDRLNNSVVATRTYGTSRLVWFGIPPDSVVNEPAQQEMIEASLGMLLRWTARLPVAGACPWRGCRASAAVVTADVEDQFGTGDAIALACHHEGVKGSFFLVGKLAPDYPEVVAALAQNGEIGSHSVEHNTFKGRPFEDQLAEMSNGKAILERLGVEHVQGFRPPMEEYDEFTLRSVAATGLRFIFGDLDYDRAYPIALKSNGSLVYQFARIAADDYNLVTERNVKDAGEYRTEYLKDFHRLHDLGGLFPFAFHTNYLAMGETVDAVRSVIAALKAEDVWITTFGEIVSWVEQRRQVSVSTSMEQGVMVVSARNDSQEDVKGFPVRLFPTTDSGKVRLVATPDSGISLRAGETSAVLEVDLVAGETREIRLR